jgi:hypothetical protein
MKKLTFRADEHLIEQACEVRKQHTTLNLAFRDWLESCAHPRSAVAEFDAVMERLSCVRPGRKFTRDEMNER